MMKGKPVYDRIFEKAANLVTYQDDFPLCNDIGIWTGLGRTDSSSRWVDR